MDWPVVILIISVLGILAATLTELVSTRVKVNQDESLRQLVSRYEQLAEKSLDAQQRIATDVSELRVRASAIEQILRSVD
jgi:hypothetical protein